MDAVRAWLVNRSPIVVALAICVTVGCAAVPPKAADDTAPSTAAVSSSTNPATPQHNRYNVLFIAVDDLRPELGCYGVDYVETPNIDALAASGVTFENHFCAVPTCGASRYALLTGRSPHRSGVRSGNEVMYRNSSALERGMQPGAQTLPELFRRSGYHTTLIGKLSHTPDGRVFAYNGKGDGREEMPHAWDDYATPYGSWRRGWGTFFAYSDGAHRENGTGQRDLMQFVVEDDDDLPDGMMATQAMAKLRERANHDEPFFMGLGFFKPHLPFVAPRQDWEAVATWPVPPPEPRARPDTGYWSKSGEMYGYTPPPGVPWKKSRPLADENAMAARRAYLACVRYVDRQIGRVLNALDELELADSTVVVLWGDHGWYLGEGAMWGKHTPHERALRTPLIVRTPNQSEPGRRTASLASTIDLYPTLVDVCQPTFTQTHHPLDGVSLVPILTQKAPDVREVATSYWQRSTSVRSATHRLILRRTKDGWTQRELYDVRSGPDGFRNVAIENPDVVERLESFAN